MNIYKDFVAGHRDYDNYDDLKANFSIEVPDNFNFAYDVVDRYAAECPQKRALVWCDDHGGEKIFSFADIAKCVNKTAHYLVSRGIKKGDAVMLILRRRYEFWWFILALHKIGAIAVPATNMLIAKDIAFRINSACIKMIVSFDDAVQTEIEAAVKEAPSVEKLITVGSARDKWESFHDFYEQFPDTFSRPADSTKNTDVMLLYFTSGTSGNPKMVQHNFAYPLGHIVTARYWQNVIDDGLHLTVAETGWAKAMWGKLYGQWLCGSAVFVYDMESFVPDKLLHRIADYGVTTFCAPPTVYRYMIRQNLDKYDLSKLQYVVTAGEALNAEVFNKIKEKLGLELHEAYGQTECTVLMGNFPGMKVKAGSMGKPAPGYDIKVVRDDGSECTAGEKGEIVIDVSKSRPFGLFSGYYRNAEMTNAVFSGGVYHTGDIAQKDEDGYFTFVGRKDDLIKTSGYRVSPFEVESILQQIPAVLECAVTGVPDEKRGQAVKATIVLAKGFEACKELELKIREFVKDHTAPYKQPRIFEFVKELPKTISGKIRHAEIRSKDKINAIRKIAQ